MEKTINIGGKDVRLNNRIGWAFEYRDQFGHDIIPTLMPMAASLLDIIGGLIRATGKTEGISYEDLITSIDTDDLMNALIHISGLEFVELINITWSLAKCADEDIPEPKIWIRQFNEFPVDVVAPAVFELIIKGVVSSKNLSRLETMIDELRPRTKTGSGSTTSSSQPQSEA